MLERIRQQPAETLDRSAYHEDFRAHRDHIEDVFWKLERRQTFSEPRNESWLAWVNGKDWDEAVRLIKADRSSLVERYERDRSLGIESRRLRIIEHPISPYLQWELNSQKVRTEAGQRMRVLDAAKLVDRETTGPLPELTILGLRVLYEVLYDSNGAGAGARRIQDPDVIRACRAEMAMLWEQAEEFLPFFEREIAPLPPPTPDRG
jgi:hypothetical protein